MSADEIAARVRAVVEARLGARVADVDVRPSPRRSTADLLEVDVHTADGAVVPLLLKLVPWAAPASRPAEVHDAGREAAVYRLVLGRRAAGAPALWDAWATEDGAALLLERTPGVALAEAHRTEPWLEAARALARLHDEATGLGRRHATAARLLRIDTASHRRGLGRARAIVKDPRMARLEAAHPEVVRRIGRLPRAFLHGEAYPANLLVDPGGAIRLVDWETAALGPGLMDVAALTSGAWEDAALRRAVALTYRDASAAWRDSGDEEFLRALDACRVQVAIGWLGWSAEWTPPPEHRHDWLGAACEALDRLGL